LEGIHLVSVPVTLDIIIGTLLISVQRTDDIGVATVRPAATAEARLEAEDAIHAHDLVLAYGDRVALRADGFSILRGTITAVIGPNGSGKSTLLGALSGLIRPRTGEVRVLGRPPRAVRRRIAYVLQESSVDGVLPITVREVVTMGRYARRGPFSPLREDDRRAVTEAMERLRIADLERRHMRELSAGQRQRVHVAQGLAQGGDVLLLDEPATGLDLPTQDRIISVLEEERVDGRTVVFTTHDISEAYVADNVLLLAGEIVAAGPPDEVLTSQQLAAAYRGQVHVTDEGLVIVDDPHHPHAHEHRGLGSASA
jgi:iron complex transport system ATP-binding protein